MKTSRLLRNLCAIGAAWLAAGCADLLPRPETRMGAAPAVTAAPAAPGTAAAGGTTLVVDRLDQDMARVLDALARLDPRPIPTLTPQQARQQPTPADAVAAVLRAQGRPTDPNALVPGVRSVDRMIAGAAGPIPARIYTPPGRGPFPVIVYYHGGGFVIATKETYDGGARGLSKEANAVVVSIDYRRAPEHKLPAPWEDALAAYRWTLANAGTIGGDPQRVALAGESAGGNLAVATAIAARDARLPLPVHVLSVYPIAQTSLDTPSYRKYADAKPLNRPMMRWFLDHTIRNAADLRDPRLNLLNARLQGLPPVTLINAAIDPLRSDGVLLQAALQRAGVPVAHRVWEGVTHEFFGMAAVVGDAKEAQAWAGQRLRAAFEAG